MTFRTASIWFAGIAALGIAKLATINHVDPESASPSRASKILRPSETTPPTPAEMLRMGPEEWKQHFEKDPASVPTQTRKAIIRLSEELQQILATGADPNGEDARVYTDAILALLSGKWEQ